MNLNENVEKQSQMIIYTTEDGLTKIETTFHWVMYTQLWEMGK